MAMFHSSLCSEICGNLAKYMMHLLNKSNLLTGVGGRGELPDSVTCDRMELDFEKNKEE